MNCPSCGGELSVGNDRGWEEYGARVVSCAKCHISSAEGSDEWVVHTREFPKYLAIIESLEARVRDLENEKYI